MMFCLVASIPCFAKNESYAGFVYWVIDGDTVQIVSEDIEFQTIRLYGIDCPEKDQENGFWAKVFTAKVCLFRRVWINPVERDRYNRLVAKVNTSNQDVNRALVKHGYAWVYDRYCQEAYCHRLHEAEEMARLQGRGVWSQQDPVPPWEWRHGVRQSPWWQFW